MGRCACIQNNVNGIDKFSERSLVAFRLPAFVLQEVQVACFGTAGGLGRIVVWASGVPEG